MKYLKKKKKSPLLPIMLILAVVVVAGLLIWALWPADGEKTPAETNAETVSAEQTDSAEQTNPAEQTDPAEQTEPAKQTDPVEQTDPAEQTEPEQTTQPERETQAPAVPEETQLPDCQVQTPYGILYLPGQWEDTIRAEVEELDFGASVVFYGTVNGREYWLYTVHYGGADGIGVGAIETKEGYFLDVTVELSDFVPDDSWSQEDVNLFSAMQESMNHLMDELRQDPAFQS